MSGSRLVILAALVAIFSLVAGASTVYFVVPRQTTTVTSSIIATSVQTVIALSTTTTTTTATVTAVSASYYFQPCETSVWNGSSFTGPYLEHGDVLVMRPNSTAYVCVVYQSAWQGNQTLYESDPAYRSYPSLVNGSYPFFPLPIEKTRCAVSPNGTITGECVQIMNNSSFEQNVFPRSITPSPATDYVLVIYEITAPPGNSTVGFYDESAPWTGCESMPLAVGYFSNPAAQINSSDFAFSSILVHSLCSVQMFFPVAEYSMGMSVIYLNFTQG
jgi:hypothetical protein